MAELNNAQLVEFCNSTLRPLADNIQRLVTVLPLIEGVYNARNLGTVINDGGAGNFVADRSDTDGRTRVTGGNVFNLITLVQDMQTFLTQGRKDVVTKWQVNGLQ